VERYSYQSHNAYLQAQLAKTERSWFDGRRLSQHMVNIAQLLKCLIGINWPLDRNSLVVCMGARRGLELAAWNLKGYHNVSGVELRPRREHERIITGDFSRLQGIFGDGSCDLIYACHSFEHCYDPAATASEWKRILKPAGVAWLSLPTALGDGYLPSESDPVLISRVTEIEKFFGPLRAVWLSTERKPGRGFDMNIVLLDPQAKSRPFSKGARREMARSIRAGTILCRLVRELSRLARRVTRTRRDYSLDICLWIQRLRGPLYRLAGTARGLFTS